MFLLPDELVRLEQFAASNPLAENHLQRIKADSSSLFLVDSYEEAFRKLSSETGYFFLGGEAQATSSLALNPVDQLQLHVFSPEHVGSNQLILAKNSQFTRMFDRGK